MRVVGSLLLAIAVTAGLLALNTVAVNHNRWQHSGLHASIGAGFAILLIASRQAWPAPRQGGDRWLRRVLVLGFAMIVIGSTLEAIGAFGYALDNGNLRTNGTIAGVHDIGLVFTPFGMLAVLVGLVGTVVMQVWFRVRRQHSIT